MQRYFIYLSYDGTRYHGWQIQPHSSSVQAELQRALTVLLREKVDVVGAGRTDTGVHARVMVAHIDIDRSKARSWLINLIVCCHETLPLIV